MSGRGVCFPLGHILSLFCACSEKKELHFFFSRKKREWKHRKYSDLGIKEYHTAKDDFLLGQVDFDESVPEPNVLDSEGNFIRFVEGTEFRADGTPIKESRRSRFGEMKKEMAKRDQIPITERIAEKRAGKEKTSATIASHRAEKATEKDRDQHWFRKFFKNVWTTVNLSHITATIRLPNFTTSFV